MEFLKAKLHINKRLKKELSKYLYYHSTEHIKDVYNCVKQIAGNEGIKGENLKLLLIAAMYHDSGFMIDAKDHEKLSCDIVRETLPDFGFSTDQIKKICGMIMATKIPQKPQNHLEEILCDADLDYLGREDFFKIGNYLFEELKAYKIVTTERDWNLLQIRFLEQHNYFTKIAIAIRKPQKELYLKLFRVTYLMTTICFQP
jgi:predicted metal-dependent HD superfamily phosphohydrolase